MIDIGYAVIPSGKSTLSSGQPATRALVAIKCCKVVLLVVLRGF